MGGVSASVSEGSKKGRGLHRQTVIYRSVSPSVGPTLGRFALIAGWGERVGTAFSRQFTLSIKDVMAASVFHLESLFFLRSKLTFNLLECKWLLKSVIIFSKEAAPPPHS